jgi:hypothetical protein
LTLSGILYKIGNLVSNSGRLYLYLQKPRRKVSPSTRLMPHVASGCRLVNREEVEAGLKVWRINPLSIKQMQDPWGHAPVIVLEEDPVREVDETPEGRCYHVFFKFIRPLEGVRDTGSIPLEHFTEDFDRAEFRGRLHHWLPIEGRL